MSDQSIGNIPNEYCTVHTDDGKGNRVKKSCGAARLVSWRGQLAGQMAGSSNAHRIVRGVVGSRALSV